MIEHTHDFPDHLRHELLVKMEELRLIIDTFTTPIAASTLSALLAYLVTKDEDPEAVLHTFGSALQKNLQLFTKDPRGNRK